MSLGVDRRIALGSGRDNSLRLKKQPNSGKPIGERASEHENFRKNGVPVHLYTDRAFTDQAFTDQAFTDQTFTEQMCAEQAFTDQAFTDQAFNPDLINFNKFLRYLLKLILGWSIL